MITYRETTKPRKKPVFIEAVRFEKPYNNLTEFCPQLQLAKGTKGGQEVDFAVIPTLEGNMRAEPGDWIIKFSHDNFYPCKSDVFEATYGIVAPHGDAS